MTILVTGGGGFLGRHIVLRLLERGEKVRIFARGRYAELEAKGVAAVQGDVRDERAVREAVDGVEAVFHVAAKVGYWGPAAEFTSINVEGTRNVLKAAAVSSSGVRRFVYTSSPSVVLAPGCNIEGGDETLPYTRSDLYTYGKTKAEGERMVLAANVPAFRTVALRPHFIYGPGDPHVIPRLVARAKNGRLVQIGDGLNKTDVTFIDNAVDAHLRAFDALAEPESRVAGNSYFIGDPEPVQLWGFVKKVLEGVGAQPVRRSISYAAAHAIGAGFEFAFRTLKLQGEPPLTRMAATILGRSHYFSHQRAKDDFGYEPSISTDEGLHRVFAS